MNVRVDILLKSLVLVMALMSIVGSATAQHLWVEDSPWHLLSSPVAFGFEALGMDDPDSGWQVAGGAIMIGLRTGENRAGYLRWPHLSFSQAGNRAADRWPGLLSPDNDESETWPGEDRVDGWGRPEVGYLGTTQWPLLGAVSYGATAWLPFTSDALYPFSVRALSWGLALRRDHHFGRSSYLAAEVRSISHSLMSDKILSDIAAPTVRQGGLLLGSTALGWDLETGYHWDDVGTRRWQALLRRSVGEGHLALQFQHNLGEPDARLLSTRLSISWSLAMSPAEEKNDETPRRKSEGRQ